MQLVHNCTIQTQPFVLGEYIKTEPTLYDIKKGTIRLPSVAVVCDTAQAYCSSHQSRPSIHRFLFQIDASFPLTAS